MMIFSSTSYPIEKHTIRIYFHQGKIVVEEGDEDGDGFFETLLLFDGDEQPVEGFTKNKDGSVFHLNKEKFAKLKKSFAIISGKEKLQE